MTWWQSILIGIVEGLTEYLPVSSTGHILLTQRLLGIPDTEASRAFAVVIQAGAILAVLGLYFKRSSSMLEGIMGKNPQGLHLLRNVLVAFLPAAVIGKLFDEKIEQQLFGLWPVTAAWFIGGVAILAVAWFKRNATPRGRDTGLTMDDITPRMALIIGLMQCVAMWPGTSRSLMVIVGGLLFGLNMVAAVEFSFLLGMITLTAAAGYKSLKFVSHPELLRDYSILTMFAGIFAAWLAAVLSVKWMVSWLQRRGITIFGYYRIGLAIVVTALLMTKVISST
ncbi:MAG: undecaprenyl-diphosphate phosphatase [Verrucomicrobiaceae bacterium]|nr:MAG: undecaprenyl-diphosphate phosphatase [Verrucomicrobiaceae bacterium]